MKLLTPNQAKAGVNDQVARDILRAKESQEALRKSRQELAESQAEFSSTLAKNRERWAQEERDHEIRVREMESEVKGLEAKKVVALAPLEERDRELSDWESFLTRWDGEVSQSEIENGDRANLLEDRLDEVGKREHECADREAKIASLEAGIAVQAESTREGSKVLSRAMLALSQDRLAAQAWIRDEQEKLSMEQSSIASRRESMDRTSRELDELRIRLLDERGTLDRAWRELKA